MRLVTFVWQNTDGSVATWLLDGSTVLNGTLIGSNPGPRCHDRRAPHRQRMALHRRSVRQTAPALQGMSRR